MSERWVPVEQRLWSKVVKSDGCWEWQGTRTRYGYGVLTSSNRGHRTRHGAHRVAWELTYGPIPDGLSVCHHCDNRLCVRPDHLFLGTNADNTADMVAKGRQRDRRSLSDAEVRLIRQSSEPQKALALRFGMTQSNISRIRSGDTYRRVA